MAIPAINVLGNPNVTEGNFQIAIEDLRKSVIGSGKAYDSANTYSQYDTCVYSGVEYYSKINSNIGNTPAIGVNWGLVSELIKLVASPTTNALAKINADGTIKNSGIIEDTNGNVGIGVTPSAWNTSYKAVDIGLTGSIAYGYGELNLGANYYATGAGTYAYKYNGQSSRYVSVSGTHTWQTAPSGTAGNAITWTNAMTLNNLGKLNVEGSTSSISVNEGYLNTPAFVQCFNSSSVNNTYIQARNVADTTAVFASFISGIVKSAIYANGNFASATNSYGSTSDIKIKENVVETSDKLDKLMNVRVVNFNYIGDDQKQIGVIAQEVEKIFPGIVYETKDTEQVEVTKTRDITDEEGNVTTEEYTETETVETGEVTKNVKYSVIYMMMLKGMQEQQAIINDLKARIEALESK